MANYEAVARSNYFTVENMKGLQKMLQGFVGDSENGRYAAAIELQPGDRNCAGKHALFVVSRGLGSAGEGGFSSLRWFAGDEDEEGQAFDPVVHVMPFVKVGEVAVFIEIGHEKMSQIVAVATAYVRRKGGKVDTYEMDLETVYAKAANALKADFLSITFAEG